MSLIGLIWLLGLFVAIFLVLIGNFSTPKEDRKEDFNFWNYIGTPFLIIWGVGGIFFVLFIID
tara:strand:- start:652 stop:840 length:189 start_codon:yes stop_codon:yes gene_type:complete